MTCFMCKGRIEDKMSTFMVDLGNCIVIVKNVPSQVCVQCGEISYSLEVASRLESIVDSMRLGIAEVAIISYSDEAA